MENTLKDEKGVKIEHILVSDKTTGENILSSLPS
jgi:hypothetical protein